MEYIDLKNSDDRLNRSTWKKEFRKLKKYIWWFVAILAIGMLFAYAKNTYETNHFKDLHVQMVWVKN